MSEPKVVPLQPARKPSAIPPIVNGVRQQARSALLKMLKALLDGVDDALFEMADRSQSNTDHHLYFDSMRQIRLHRGEIEKAFIEALNDGFERSYAAGNGNPQDSIANAIAAEIGLMGNDDLEISVAISGIVSKITSLFSLPIMELTKRFNHLAKHATISERSNPLGPQMVSEAFNSAIDDIDVDIKIRIILLKLFERLVMQNMGPVYELANRAMADAGVLKDLRRALTRGRNPENVSRSSGSGRPVHGDGRAAGVRGESGNSGAFGADGAPASGGAGGQYARPGGTATGTGTPDYHAAGSGYGRNAGPGNASEGMGHGEEHGGFESTGGVSGDGAFGTIQSLLARARGPAYAQPVSGSVLATPELLSVLNAVQSESGDNVSVEQVPPLLDLRQVVVSRARDITGEAMNQLGRADEDVVNFIGMLFDYILNDRNLAIPMKALIARLQIPVVKLAILDKTFFDRSSHPARQLLNELSSAGIGWSSAAELKRDAVYDKIESVVIRVLNGFSDNPGIFQDLLDELRDFRGRDTARNARMEQRVKDTEAGKAKTLAARQEVQKVINQKACGLRLPHDLGRFLSEIWSRALVYVSVREGANSPSWQALMASLDDLLWAMQPLDDLEQIEQRDELIEGLLARLTAGMALIQLSEPDQVHWCERIRAQVAEVSENDRAYLVDDEAPRVSEAFEEMEEIVLAAPHEVTDSYQGDPPTPDFVEKINSLSEGCWVELRGATDTIRCKLASIVTPGDRYVFVNRRGMKVAEKTRMQLARELQDDVLVLLNDSQVFDRALQAVIGNLRQIQSQPAPA